MNMPLIICQKQLKSVPLHPIMADIKEELQKLHSLSGVDFVKQLRLITELNVFRPFESEDGIFYVGGDHDPDFPALLNAAKKAVEHGNQVFILPNPRQFTGTSAEAFSNTWMQK